MLASTVCSTSAVTPAPETSFLSCLRQKELEMQRKALGVSRVGNPSWGRVLEGAVTERGSQGLLCSELYLLALHQWKQRFGRCVRVLWVLSKRPRNILDSENPKE